MAGTPIGLWRAPRFWGAQSAWWLMCHAMFVALDVQADRALFLKTGMPHYGVSTLLAMMSSGALACLYVRLPPHWLRGAGVLGVVALGSLGAAVLWNLGVTAHLRWMTAYPVELTERWAVAGIFSFARVLLAWSVLFLLWLQARRSVALREQELATAASAHGAALRSFRSEVDPQALLSAIDEVSSVLTDDAARGRTQLRSLARELRRALKSSRARREDAPSAGDDVNEGGHPSGDMRAPAMGDAPAQEQAGNIRAGGPWGRHALVGIVVYAAVVGFDCYSALQAGRPLGDVVASLGVGLMLAGPASWVLTVLVDRFPRLWRSGGSLSVTALIALSLSVGLSWALGVSTVNAGRAGYDVTLEQVVRLVQVGSWLFLAWVCFLLLVAVGQQQEVARVRIVRNRSLAHEAELRALQWQLQPHFLFNALNSVLPMIRLDPPAARAMLADLRELMVRAFATTRTDSTTLAEEIDFLTHYLRCEAARFRGMLSFTVLLPDALRDLPIASLLLQPLVENAVKHGMVATSQHLTIELEVGRVGGRLVVEVRNTGALKTTPGRTHGGLGEGLRIVRERLATGYPKSGRFALLVDGPWVLARVHYDPAERPLELAPPASLAATSALRPSA